MGVRVMKEPCLDCGRTGRVYGGYARCNGCYKRLLRHADPGHAERDREVSRRWKAQNRERNRARDRQYSRDIRDPCPHCGQLKGRDQSQCLGCCETTIRARRSLIEGMWADGWTMREIAGALGTTRDSLSVTMVRMRRDGWDLPHRYRMENGRRAAA